MSNVQFSACAALCLQRSQQLRFVGNYHSCMRSKLVEWEKIASMSISMKSNCACERWTLASNENKFLNEIVGEICVRSIRANNAHAPRIWLLSARAISSRQRTLDTHCEHIYLTFFCSIAQQKQKKRRKRKRDYRANGMGNICWPA